VLVAKLRIIAHLKGGLTASESPDNVTIIAV